MSSAADRGWPVARLGSSQLTAVAKPNPTQRELEAGVLKVPGIQLNLRNEVAPLFRAFIVKLDEARRRDGRSPVTSGGGYNFRAVRGYESKWASTGDPRYLSNHSWGLAADLCVATNPMGSPLRTDMPADTREIAASCGLQWGAEWSRPDPMHIEFVGTPAEAAEWARRLEEEDFLSADAIAKINAIHDELFKRHANRTGDPGADGVDTMAGYAINADGYGYRLEHLLRDPQPSRVAGSDVTLSPIDALYNIDAATFRTEQRIAGLDAGLKSLADLLAARVTGLTSEQVLATVREAIEEAVVKVDVSVTQPSPPTPPVAIGETTKESA
ncbi:M15 family metallopeptidase [Kineococcus esterisolvens]|uniref:M15 family metallopeptidase n=1 Tax=unclassified Kineococcus TaxID=2621656 RepID=UPI003D7CA28F